MVDWEKLHAEQAQIEKDIKKIKENQYTSSTKRKKEEEEEQPVFTAEKEQTQSFNIPKKEQIKTLKDSSGRVVGVEDPVTQQSYMVSPTDETKVREFEQKRYSAIEQARAEARARRQARENLRPANMSVEEFRIKEGYATKQDYDAYLKTEIKKYPEPKKPSVIKQAFMTEEETQDYESKRLAYAQNRQKLAALSSPLSKPIVKTEEIRSTYLGYIKQREKEEAFKESIKPTSAQIKAGIEKARKTQASLAVGIIPEEERKRQAEEGNKALKAFYSVTFKPLIESPAKFQYKFYTSEVYRQFKQLPKGTQKDINDRITKALDNTFSKINPKVKGNTEFFVAEYKKEFVYQKPTDIFRAEEFYDTATLAAFGFGMGALEKVSLKGFTKTGLKKVGTKALIYRQLGKAPEYALKVSFGVEAYKFAKSPTSSQAGRTLGMAALGFAPDLIRMQTKKDMVRIPNRRYNEDFLVQQETIRKASDKAIIDRSKSLTKKMIVFEGDKYILTRKTPEIRQSIVDIGEKSFVTSKQGKYRFKGVMSRIEYGKGQKGYFTYGILEGQKTPRVVKVFTKEIPTFDESIAFKTLRAEAKVKGYKKPFDISYRETTPTKFKDINTLMEDLGKSYRLIEKKSNLGLFETPTKKQIGKFKIISLSQTTEPIIRYADTGEPLGRMTPKRAITSTYKLTPEEYLGYLRRKGKLYSKGFSEKEFNRLFRYEIKSPSKVAGFFQTEREIFREPEVVIKLLKGKKTGKLKIDIYEDLNTLEMPVIAYKQDLGYRVKGYKPEKITLRQLESGKLLPEVKIKYDSSFYDKLKFAFKKPKFYPLENDIISHEIIHYRQPKIFRDLSRRLPYKIRPSEIEAYSRSNPFELFKVTETRKVQIKGFKEYWLETIEIGKSKGYKAKLPEIKELPREYIEREFGDISFKQIQKKVVTEKAPVIELETPQVKRIAIRELTAKKQNLLLFGKSVSVRGLVSLTAQKQTQRQISPQKSIIQPRFKEVTITMGKQNALSLSLQKQSSASKQMQKQVQRQAVKQAQKVAQMQKKTMENLKTGFGFKSTPVYTIPKPVKLPKGGLTIDMGGNGIYRTKKKYVNELEQFLGFFGKRKKKQKRMVK